MQSRPQEILHVGDRVKYFRGTKVTHADGWTLDAGRVAVVTGVDKDGNVKLRNPEGRESSIYHGKVWWIVQVAHNDKKNNDQASKTTQNKQQKHVRPEQKIVTGPDGKQVCIVMTKYRMHMSKEDVMGEGTSSICRKGTNTENNELLAIKVYKAHKEGSKHEDVKLQKFKRQIQVLKELQEPFIKPQDERLWSEQLARAKPARLFMELLDYSQDAASGEPGCDPTDGILYVITELAQYSLKDYLALRRDQSKPLPKESVRNITKAIILVMAGLHAKGLVHIDLKPENLMMFNGRLKLIDVDGCVKAGSSVSIQDSSISFSPCYCAPEWAKFLIEEDIAGFDVTNAGTAEVNGAYTKIGGHAPGDSKAGSFWYKQAIKGHRLYWYPEYRGSPQGWYCDHQSNPGKALYFVPGTKDAVPRNGWTVYTGADSSPGVAPPPILKIQDSESKIKINPALDVWSVGMTICELVSLDAILKPMYANFLRNGHSHKEAGFFFMEWLSGVKKAPIPKSIEKFDPGLADLLTTWLLVNDPVKRKTCAQSLAHPYINTGDKKKDKDKEQDNAVKVDEPVVRRERHRKDDDTSKAPIYMGTLWKLNSGGKPKDPVHWLKRDMWVASNGAMCYFSVKHNKRLVLIDGAKLPGAQISKYTAGCKDNSFEVKISMDEGEQGDTAFYFACETSEQYTQWTEALNRAAMGDDMVQSMQFGANMAQDLRAFKINVKNRRQKIDGNEKDQFAPVFKGKLWKVKAEGDRMKEEDWFEREMWIAKNGSLVYYSKKEERELVYYTSDDISRATFTEVSNQDSFRPWSFQVQLPPADNIEYAPGEFAAESEAMRKTWIAEFKKVQGK